MEWARIDCGGADEMKSALGFPTCLFMSLKLLSSCSPKAQAVGIPDKSRCR